ncbi:uncharacterized protein ACNS7B_005049 isoform 1-T1 [Menidia menidia]
MLLHGCLLLFIISADKTSALSDHHCGGNVSLDQDLSGHINLTIPGHFATTSRPDPMIQLSGKALNISLCTWVLDIPLGRTVLLYVVELESGSNISVQCDLAKGPQALQSKGTALLSGCDRNKAALSWTGTGRFPNEVQLAYYVQEDERNSSEVHSTKQPDGGSTGWSQTGTSFTSTTVVTGGVLGTADDGKGYPHEAPGSTSGPPSVSSVSPQDEWSLSPTSPGLPDAGRADRETLPLPEEGPNNGADTSGAAHLTDEAMTARTRPHFRTPNTESTTVSLAKLSSPPTPMPRTDEAITHSIPLLGTDIPKSSKHTDKRVTTQKDHRVSSSSILDFPPSKGQTWESDTTLPPHGGAVVQTEDEQHFSGRSQRNAEGLDSDLTPATILNPLKSSDKPHDSRNQNADAEPTLSSASFSQDPRRSHSPIYHNMEPVPSAVTVEASSVHPITSQSDSFVVNVSAQTGEFKLDDKFQITDVSHTLVPFTPSQTKSPKSTESISQFSQFTRTSDKDTQTATKSTQRNVNDSSSPGLTESDGQLSGSTVSFSTTEPSQTQTVLNLAATAITGEMSSPPAVRTVHHDRLKNDSATVLPLLSSGSTTDSSLPATVIQTQTAFPGDTRKTSQSPMRAFSLDYKSPPESSQPSCTPQTLHHPDFPTSTNIPTAHTQSHNGITPAFPSLTINLDSTTAKPVTPAEASAAMNPSPWNTVAPTPSVLNPTSVWATTKSPLFYIVPNQPASIRVESVELLLQIVVDDSRSASTPRLEEDTTAWVVPYLQRAPGFSKIRGIWSSGHAVQSLIEFKTSGALQWIGTTGPVSLLERIGLAQVVREGKTFRSSKITNVTLGGLQGDVCGWLLQCPAGYKCGLHPGTGNYSCSSVCRFDHCHHHGICTHHPGQPPVCRCLVGDDFWYMGQRCDMKMTRARLISACLAILLTLVTVIGILAFVAVRRYRAVLIQAKVDQTRSSYRRFNHFDELSGRFWLRSWAGSADSLDNPAFMRSDELLHLRALDRPCCYHDDTLSLASTCPSHGARINTIYPHSSQYGWRGSEMSVGDGVLDSGKASDLSVCSWPVEPIHWTPFPLLQQLASHRTPPQVRVARPRSYCEGMELVDLEKSWTA